MSEIWTNNCARGTSLDKEIEALIDRMNFTLRLVDCVLDRMAQKPHKTRKVRKPSLPRRKGRK